MSKGLQQIKDEVAIELGYKPNSVFNAYEQLLINPHGLTYKVLSDSVDQVAIRYAQEQKRKFVEMLEITRQMCIKRQFPSENELKEMASEIDELIKKHNERV